MAGTVRNILFIIADQFRWDCLGAAGNRLIQTPNLDALARQGTLFSRCFVQTSPCGPSRMCIFTGRYMCSTRAVNNYTPLMDAHENFVQCLSDAGCRTAVFGYNDYAVDPRILPASDPRTRSLSFSNYLPGFHTIYAHEYHSPEYFASLHAKGYPEDLCGPAITTSYNVPKEGPGDHLPLHYPALYAAEDSECRFLAERACDYIRDNRDGGWFANVNFIKPHPPRICPAPYHAMYAAADMPPANRVEEELNAAHPYLHYAHASPALASERDLRETRACYYGMISEVDAAIGVILQTLRDTGQWDNTAIVFTSDHGEYLGDHYFLDKGHFYDETMRVPLIVRDPRKDADATRGGTLDALVESVDLSATILEMAGLDVPDRIQGRSLVPQIHGDEAARTRHEVHFEFDFRGRYEPLKGEDPDSCVLWVLRDHAFKYVQFGLECMPSLLFDLVRDPGEHRNLAADPAYAAVVAEYCRRMIRWRMKHEDQRMEHWAAKYR